jgi:mannose-6-phosphate isomerase-like protein (cupin superfamily)
MSEIVEWRQGVRTRIIAAASTGATQLCLFEQWSDRGTGAPWHAHPGCEEAVAVLAGEADFQVADEQRAVRGGDTVLVPPGVRHRFTNVGAGVLHTMAVFPVPSPPVVYEDEPGTLYEVGVVRAEMRDAHRAVIERS